MKQPFLLLALFYLLITNNYAQASYLEVTMLGTGTPRPDINRFGPSTVIETKGKFFVFDSGRGTTIRLQQAGIPLSSIEHVFITHLHSDHISGLADLWLTSWVWQRQHKLAIYGPQGIKNLTHHMRLAYQNDIHFRTSNTLLDVSLTDITTQEIKSDGIVYNKNGITITAFTVNHGLVKPALGYRIDSDEHSVVISGDTSYSKNLIKHAKGTDLLIHEIADADGKLLQKNPRLKNIIAYHTTPEQAASVLNQVKPRITLLTHVLLFGISEEAVLGKTKSLYDGAVHIANDLLKIGIGEEIIFYPPPKKQFSHTVK